MSLYKPATGSLALYKIRPARVTGVGEKIEIDLGAGKVKRVRPKDIAILHPGPLERLDELEPVQGDLDEAWELLAGETTHLEELASLIYGDFTPATAWAAWERVAEGLYFEGSPQQITVRSAQQVAADLRERERKAVEEQVWEAFIQRLRQGRIEAEDRQRLQEVEQLALERSESSRILQQLGHKETPVNAHRMLVRVGYWSDRHNPYPTRQAVSCEDPELILPELEAEERVDLTHLPAYAIDDEGSDDPDDALSLDGERLWVHVADVAAVVAPDSELDLEARARAANLYLPEGVVHMLPPRLTGQLALGRQPVSPALSIGFRVDAAGELDDLKLCRSLVRVSRHAYDTIDRQMGEAPFDRIKAITDRFRSRRLAAGASQIDLPEVGVKVINGEIVIRPLRRLDSRQMVTEAMLMAGEAIARYAGEQGLPVPYATQPGPDNPAKPAGPAAMYAYRRQMKPSRSTVDADVHAGLGLGCYSRTTSPLRRYLDLVTHQQLRALLAGREPLGSEQVSERIAAVEAGTRSIRRTERLSNLHWKLLYLKERPQWQGEGVVVEMKENRATLLVPELAMETRLRVRSDYPLDSRLRIALREVDVEDQAVWFRLLE
ncbi:MAG: RNB domain-containing ribonuclease [Sedimenticola sp.]|nr:RNB domain-containing ribonuclease [Sedimenticola sp.]